MPFLDIQIKKSENHIETDIYYKPTDSKEYLLFNSCHPKHVTTKIPHNLARRICTIVDRKGMWLKELRFFLKNQNYRKTLIEVGIQNANCEKQYKHCGNQDNSAIREKFDTFRNYL